MYSDQNVYNCTGLWKTLHKPILPTVLSKGRAAVRGQMDVQPWSMDAPVTLEFSFSFSNSWSENENEHHHMPYPFWLRWQIIRLQCRRTGFDPRVRKIPWISGMATLSSILAWRIPWIEEPGRLQFVGLQRVRHNWVTKHTCLSVFSTQRDWDNSSNSMVQTQASSGQKAINPIWQQSFLGGCPPPCRMPSLQPHPWPLPATSA